MMVTKYRSRMLKEPIGDQQWRKKTVNIKQAEVQHKITELLISWLPQDNSQNRCIIRIIANRELQIDRQLVVEYA